jgi:hypothetical protein
MRQTEPTVITKGERIEWEKEFCDYPSDEWALQYRFRGGGTGFDADAIAGPGRGFTLEITAANSLSAEPGKYRWQAWLTEIADSTNTQMVAGGVITVEPGFVAGDAADVDLRTPEKIALDAIDAALANAATSDQLEYEISTPVGSRRIKRMARTELIELRRHYAAIVSRQNTAERLRNGGKFGKPVKVTMSSD